MKKMKGAKEESGGNDNVCVIKVIIIVISVCVQCTIKYLL